MRQDGHIHLVDKIKSNPGKLFTNRARNFVGKTKGLRGQGGEVKKKNREKKGIKWKGCQSLVCFPDKKQIGFIVR